MIEWHDNEMILALVSNEPLYLQVINEVIL